MTDKDKIIAEINRRLDAQDPLNYTEKDHIESNVYYSLLKYIKELPKEPTSKDLDKAAKDSGQRHFPDEYNIWARPNYEAKHAEMAFKEGANWQKEQMMLSAVQGFVNTEYQDVVSVKSRAIEGEERKKLGLHLCAKVKLIIVKED